VLNTVNRSCSIQYWNSHSDTTVIKMESVKMIFAEVKYDLKSSTKNDA